MEIIGPIATKISDYVIDAIFRELGYLVYYKDNMKGLKKQAENLVSIRSRVQHLIDEAKNKAEDIEDDVSIWLTNMDEITEETYRFLLKIVEEKEKKCINGSCFNFIRRHRLSRKAKKMVEELAHIQDQGNFDKVSYPGPLPKLKNTSNYVTFDSRLSILEDIIEALKDPNVSMIGVHGMGGIGKTMLVKDVSCRVMESKSFETVILVTIGQNPELKQIQGQLADMLMLSLGQETEQGRAALLQKRLQMETSILIILDDIWNGLDLERVGIPCGGDYEGCKILVTSRSIHVLSDKMNIEKNFEVKSLSEEESWDFFKSVMGKSGEMTSLEWKKIAINVAKKCGNLPIALATVAKALRGKRLHAWKDALRQLNNPATVDIEGVSKEVYASLKLSYDNLSCLEAKLLFLLCSMFPDDYDINKDILVRYAIGLKFLQGVDTLETTRDRIFTLVDDLESSCMLQKSEVGSKYVKMHDVVRDVAIYISSKNDQICTLSYGKGLNMWRDEDTHGHYTAVLANYEDFEDLPKKLKFPKLEVLALVSIKYRDNVCFPEEFFEGMEKLKVLHIESMELPQPPSSFHCMINLRTLVLVNCELENIDMIVELKNLEILNISGSRITDLPSSTCQLSRLKELNLLNCNGLEVIQSEVISKLTKLEALLISTSCNGWDEVEGSKKENASLVELQHLHFLNTLYISVQNVEQLPRKAFSNNSKLDEFQINICGCSTFETNKALEINMLERKKNDRNLFLEEGVRMLLKKAEELVLIEAFGLKDVLFEINRSDVLKILQLGYDEDVEYLVNTQNEMVSIFPNLEKLTISSMERLDRIIRIGSIKTVKIFGNLKELSVKNCDKLKYLFPLSIMEALHNLEEIMVESCNMLEAIVLIDEQKLEYCSQLRRLIMSELPQFMSICCKIVHDEAINTEIVEEDQIVANFMTPFDGQVVFPNFKHLKMSKVKNVRDCELNGDYKLMKVESIEFSRCENLKSIFTLNTMVMLKEFTKLTVSYCDSLEEIFNMNEGDVIPSLTSVRVFKCGKLRRIFPTFVTNHLHQLQVIYISECGIVELFSNNQSELQYSKVSFPNLKRLDILREDNLEVIWQNGLIVDDLSNLRSLILMGCKSIKSIVTLTEVKLVEELELLGITNCDSLEEIFTIHNKLPHLKEDSVPINFKLKKIILNKLPNLKQLWSEDFDGLCHFPHLVRISVSECPNFRNPFPSSLESYI